MYFINNMFIASTDTTHIGLD